MQISGFFLFPIFGSGFLLYFLPTIVAPAAREIRQGFHLSAEFLPGMERDWMDCGPGVGLQE